MDNPSSGTESSEIGKKSSEKASLDGVTKKLDDLSSSEFPSEPNSESHGSLNVPPNDENFKGARNVPETEPKPSNVTDIDPCYDNHIPSLPTSSGLSERRMSCSPSHFIPTSPETISCQFSPEVQSGKQTSEGTSGKNKLDSSDLQHNRFSFDICEERSSSGVKLKTSLHIKNKAIRNEKLRAEGDNIKIIRPGMILLKAHMSLNDQVTCHVYVKFLLVHEMKVALFLLSAADWINLSCNFGGYSISLILCYAFRLFSKKYMLDVLKNSMM